ncbi:MAG: hypothetical protein RIC52_15855 [Amphiplicatus sp.]
MISRIATSLAGLVLVVYGLIAALSPFLPAGVPLVVLGLLMIALANPAARPLIRRMRTRWRWFDRFAVALGARAPKNVRAVIEETTPAAPEKSEDQ